MHQGYDGDFARAGAAVPRAIAAPNIPDVMITSRTRCLSACVRCHDNCAGRGCGRSLQKLGISLSLAIHNMMTTANGMYAVQKIESKNISRASLLLSKCELRTENAGPLLLRFDESCAIAISRCQKGRIHCHPPAAVAALNCCIVMGSLAGNVPINASSSSSSCLSCAATHSSSFVAMDLQNLRTPPDCVSPPAALDGMTVLWRVGVEMASVSVARDITSIG